MIDTKRTRFRSGFSLVELIAVLVMAASVTSVLGPAMGRMRTQMRGVTSEGNLASIGQVGAMYGVDNEDRIFTYTWRGDVEFMNLRDGRYYLPDTDLEAAGWQAQNILQRATGRLNGVGRILAPYDHLVHRRWSHLVLADYLGGNVTDPMWADPSDQNLLNWQLNPLEYLEDDNSIPYSDGFPDPRGYDDNGVWLSARIKQLWSFGSSYQVVPHAWQQDFGNQYIPVIETPHLFQSISSSVPLGERRFHEVRFPSAKVHMFEEFDREQEGLPYFAYDHARPAKLMFDGSINTAMSGLAQSSVSPEDYLVGDKIVWEQTYVPFETFPIPLGGLGDQTLLNQRFRWTLGGLRGVNYPQTLYSGHGR
tara:strand:- start:152 stop:1243 length:1092 start_codon:yes stop_codon:yes gene_type:complete